MHINYCARGNPRLIFKAGACAAESLIYCAQLLTTPKDDPFPKIKKPDRDIFISRLALIFADYAGNNCFTEKIYFHPSYCAVKL